MISYSLDATGRGRTSLEARDLCPEQKRDGDANGTVMTFESVGGKATLSLRGGQFVQRRSLARLLRLIE